MNGRFNPSTNIGMKKYWERQLVNFDNIDNGNGNGNIRLSENDFRLVWMDALR